MPTTTTRHGPKHVHWSIGLILSHVAAGCQGPSTEGFQRSKLVTNITELARAVDSAEAGTTISIQGGHYKLSKPIEIDKPLTIVGTGGMFETRVEAPGLRAAFRILPDGRGTKIEGLDIESPEGTGIEIVGTQSTMVEDVSVEHCRFMNNKVGINLRWAKAKVHHNLFVDNKKFAVLANRYLAGELYNNTSVGSGFSAIVGQGVDVHHNIIVNRKNVKINYAITLVGLQSGYKMHDNLASGTFSRRRFRTAGKASDKDQTHSNLAWEPSAGFRDPEYVPMREEFRGFGYREPKLITVNAVGDNDPMTLARAIEEATAGDTITMRDGVYRIFEPVILNKPLRIVSEGGMFRTKIEGSSLRHAILIEPSASGTELRGLTVKNTGGVGLQVRGKKGSIVKDVYVHRCRFLENVSAIDAHWFSGEMKHNLMVGNGKIALRAFHFQGGSIHHNTVVDGGGILGSLTSQASIHHNLIVNKNEAEAQYALLLNGLEAGFSMHNNVAYGTFTRGSFRVGGLPAAKNRYHGNVTLDPGASFRAPRYTSQDPSLLGVGYFRPGFLTCEEGQAQRCTPKPFVQHTVRVKKRLGRHIDGNLDGLPDSWQRSVVDRDPFDAVEGLGDVAPDADPDGDGLTNVEEHALDLDPLVRSEISPGIRRRLQAHTFGP